MRAGGEHGLEEVSLRRGCCWIDLSVLGQKKAWLNEG